ncbi:MAG: hypothetical protein RIQ75_469 [Pseudomonadota bacterium]
MIANAHRALTNALLKIATPAEIPESRERPWASVTFTGARHWVAISSAPPAPTRSPRCCRTMNLICPVIWSPTLP